VVLIGGDEWPCGVPSIAEILQNAPPKSVEAQSHLSLPRHIPPFWHGIEQTGV